MILRFAARVLLAVLTAGAAFVAVVAGAHLWSAVLVPWVERALGLDWLGASCLVLVALCAGAAAGVGVLVAPRRRAPR